MATTTLIGKTIGQYRIVSEIGRGGMAIVYKAEQPSLNRFVALKILLPNFTGEDSSVERLQREARAAASLDHPNIVDIYEVGEQDDLHYIAMKFVEGRPLNTLLLEDQPLSVERVLRILAQVASALDYAHRQNLVHRDIKPSNIIVGPGDRVTLTDFGLVKATGSETLTSSGALVGTPTYMSPEQARGVETDYRGDIYSLGVVCFEMFGGRPPFCGNPLSIIMAHANQTPPSLHTFRDDLPPMLEVAVLRALAKNPGERYATAGEFVATLRQAISWQEPAAGEHPPMHTPIAEPTPLPNEPAPATSRPAMRWGGIAAALTLLAALVVALILIFGAPKEPAATRTPVAALASATAQLASSTASAQLAAATATLAPTDTAVPATSTNQPTSTPAPTDSPTPMPTDTETPVIPTQTPVPVATSTSGPPTATRAALVQRISLLTPADGQFFQSTDTPTLSWSGAQALAAGEQFVVVVDRQPQPPNTGIWHDYHITTETSRVVPRYLAETSIDGRLEWYVQVMRNARVDGGVLAGQIVGQPSPRRSFTWVVVPSAGEEPGGPKPTPTRDD